MKLLDDYLDLKRELFDYFGYVEDWRVLPIEDTRSAFWELSGEGFGDHVKFAETMEQMNSDGDYYQNEIYTQRHLPKWVYEGEKYTMICVDTHMDGNQFLQIFSNDKRI